MVAQLSYSRITGSIIPIDANGQVLSALAAKLVSGKPLLMSEFALVSGFRSLFEITSRRVGSTGKLYLALRVVLEKDGVSLDKVELIDRYSPRISVVSNEPLTIPRLFDSYLGVWKISVGYAALYEHELVPAYIQTMLKSLPYVFDDGNNLKFEVVQSSGTVKPNGEWANGTNARELANSGRTRPSDI